MSNTDLQSSGLPDAGAAHISDDDALGAIWDQASAETAGQDRGEDGKFKGAEAGEGEPADANADAPPAEGDEEGEGAEGEAQGDQAATPGKPAVALPANWSGMDEDWKKIPADVQEKIAARDAELHSRMSEQGRQIGTMKPIMDVVERNGDLLQGKTLPDGSPVTMPFAVNFLMEAQRMLDADPIGSLIQIADRYGARDMLTAVLTGQAKLPPAPKAQQPAGVSPADVQTMVREALTVDQQARKAEEEIGRLSKDKPLFASIPEGDMVHAIQKARAKLGDAASNDAVFNLAYDIAVHADPDLRAKATAAAPKAAVPDPKRTADARRAASVNVTSTSTGKARKLTDDEVLAQAYDAATQKDR